MLTDPENIDNTEPCTSSMGNFPEGASLPSGSFYCSVCKFTTTKSKTYDKHLLTEKHKYSVAVIDAYDTYADLMSEHDYEVQPLPEDSLIRTSHRCYCGKIYKHRQSLCIHKKKCTYVIPPHDPPPIPTSVPAPEPIPIPAPRPTRTHTSTLTTEHPPNLITDPADIILVPPFTPEQIRDAIFAIDAYETAVNEPSVNTFPDSVNIAACATSAVLVTAESLSANVTADSSISAIANVIASSFSEETRELCIHREVVVRCIKLVLPLYLNLLTRMNMQEDEDLPEDMIEVIDPEAPITVGYLTLKSCVNILYFILSRIDEQPINEGDDVVDISNSR
jgi:hypothetical protein